MEEPFPKRFKIENYDFQTEKLGDPMFDSPLPSVVFIEEDAKVLLDVTGSCRTSCAERVGPHRKIFFNPANTKVGIVSCGGLCPGL